MFIQVSQKRSGIQFAQQLRSKVGGIGCGISLMTHQMMEVGYDN
jgi:hypothetical protein